jgi:hypothetical protein
MDTQMINPWHKWAYRLSMAIIIISILGWLYISYLLYIDWNPPIIFEQYNNITVIDKEYKAGDYIAVKSSWCLKTSAPSTVYYTVVGIQEYFMSPMYMVWWKNFKWKCFKDNISYYRLPKQLPSWEYHLSFTTKYDVNKIATRYVYWTTEKFYVIGRNSDWELLPK